MRLARWLLVFFALTAASAQAFWDTDPVWYVPVKPQKISLREVYHAGAARKINGYLFKSPQSSGRLVIYGPGCNGADKTGREYHAEHIKRFHAGNLDVLLLNSVSDRGLGEGGTCFIEGRDSRYVHTPMISGDALAAVAWARKNGYEPGQIGYFGFSHGSRAGLWLAAETSRRNNTPAELREDKLSVAAIAVVYPDCRDWAQIRGIGPLVTPLMIWGGDKDENQPALCANMFPEASRKAELKSRIFNDTYHGYGFNAPKRETLFAGSHRLTSAYNPEAQEETFAGTVEWFNKRLK